MTQQPPPPLVEDRRDENRFVLQDGDTIAELTYHQNGKRFVLIHTGVPDEMGGRGIGGQLVRAALARAVDEGLTIVPNCPFAREWLEKHPDVAAGVSIDWT